MLALAPSSDPHDFQPYFARRRVPLACRQWLTSHSSKIFLELFISRQRKRTGGTYPVSGLSLFLNRNNRQHDPAGVFRVVIYGLVCHLGQPLAV